MVVECDCDDFIEDKAGQNKQSTLSDDEDSGYNVCADVLCYEDCLVDKLLQQLEKINHLNYTFMFLLSGFQFLYVRF